MDYCITAHRFGWWNNGIGSLRRCASQTFESLESMRECGIRQIHIWPTVSSSRMYRIYSKPFGNPTYYGFLDMVALVRGGPRKAWFLHFQASCPSTRCMLRAIQLSPSSFYILNVSHISGWHCTPEKMTDRGSGWCRNRVKSFQYIIVAEIIDEGSQILPTMFKNSPLWLHWEINTRFCILNIYSTFCEHSREDDDNSCSHTSLCDNLSICPHLRRNEKANRVIALVALVEVEADRWTGRLLHILAHWYSILIGFRQTVSKIMLRMWNWWMVSIE